MSPYVALLKPRLTSLSVASAVAGFLLGLGHDLETSLFWWSLLGIVLTGGGANAFNMVAERDHDARMNRTMDRPIPSRQLDAGTALSFAVILAGGGVYVLSTFVNPLAGWLGILTLVSYCLVYTPLKRVTTFNTWVGAIPGALPPLIGYAAATGTLDRIVWILAVILFVWQIPHFLAISWIHREDYRRAGFSMLSVVDDDSGSMTARQVLVSATAMTPVSLFPAVYDRAGPLYSVVAFVLGVGFFVVALMMFRRVSELSARLVFRYSVFYLAVLMLVLVADRRLFLHA